MDTKNIRLFVLGIGFGIIMVGSMLTGAAVDRVRGISFLDRFFQKNNNVESVLSRQVINEESVITQAVEKASPSVVTVSMVQPQSTGRSLPGLDIFGNFFNQPQPTPSSEANRTQDIGTGFVINSDGLIVTNKHVVADTTAKYKVVIGKDEVQDVINIYRDPLTDMAILKVNRSGLTPMQLGDSDKVKVGQTVIAIGTVLGEFRSTVTTGVISGLGRGIVAGSAFEGSEKLDNVIQTDAAINPGNSGGPLLNSSGQVIGVNVAVSQAGQGIGFALPINLVKESINNFKTTGEFDRPFLGVSYRIISIQAALINEVPAGAYVQEVVVGSSADKAGIKQGDILIEIDGNKLADGNNTTLANIVNKKKIGDNINVKLWRENQETQINVMLEKSN